MVSRNVHPTIHLRPSGEGKALMRMQKMRAVLGLTLLLAGTISTVHLAQERNTPRGEWRYQSGDAGGTRFSPLDQIDASNFEKLRVGVDLPRRQLRPGTVHQFPLDPDLRERHAVFGGGTAPHRGRHGSQDRGSCLDLPRTAHHSLAALHARGLREGCRPRRGGRPRSDSS